MSDAAARIRTLLQERIVVIDGAMGTMIQGYTLDEAGFRGTEFAGHPRTSRGTMTSST
jgi:5-methyltetrahydrofolate--homocysteine methyltransferase